MNATLHPLGLVASWYALLATAVPIRQPVRPGIDVLVTDSIHLVQGRRVGLVANHASVDQHGVHAIERLRNAGVTLVALFSPEHGFRGAADPGEEVPTTTDAATGLPIYSLYGKNFAPTAAMLQGIDLLLVDLPDVGTRYFTYVATTAEVMKAAGPAGVPVVILDRPNPLGGTVGGNVLDVAYQSFVGRFSVPMRYGLTLAEMARWFGPRLGVPPVGVVPVAGWRRRDDAFTTGLPFIAPSPNLQDVESLFHYPGSCLFEGTALSVGRGTERGFSQIGAPWLDTTRVLALVRRARLPGVRFQGTSFTPRKPGDGKFADTTVVGIGWHLTDRRRYDPIRTALVMLTAVRQVHPDRIGWNVRHFDRLAGGAELRLAVDRGESPDRIIASWRPALAAFQAEVRPFLLYR